VVIERATIPGSADLSWSLDLKVVNGSAILPWPLPAGNMKATAAKPVALTWMMAGDSFSTPTAASTYADCSRPLTHVAVSGDASWLTIERQPPCAAGAFSRTDTRTVPLAVRVPEGIKEVIWKGEQKPVKDGGIDLAW